MLIILVLAVAPVVSMALDKTLEPCQKEFVRGHRAYKDGDFGTAASAFLKCDGNYPLLQKYITEFLLKVGSGGDKFQYIDPAVQNSVEIEMTMTPFDLANAYFKARDYAKAEELFKETAHDKKFKLASLEMLATSLARLEKYNDAITIHRQIIKEFPHNKKAIDKALFKIGFLLMDGGDYAATEKEFLALGKRHSSYMRSEAKWYLAWSYYKQGKFDAALKELSFFEKGRDNGLRARALYWKARITDERSIYEKLVMDYPRGYYGILAAQKIGIGMVPIDQPPVRSRPPNQFNLLATAYELDILGIHELVEMELESIISSKRNNFNADEILKLAVKNDAWHVVAVLSPYPRGYPNMVREFAKRYRVDKDFIWAVMKEESTFKKDIVSRSGAVGLMQLMPATAAKMFSYSFEAKRLLDPRFNIDAGVGYLAFLLKHYKGDKFLAAAAYNAGEEVVDRWLKDKKDKYDILEFVEEIPYRETIDYVRKVLKAYWIYSQSLACSESANLSVMPAM